MKNKFSKLLSILLICLIVSACGPKAATQAPQTATENTATESRDYKDNITVGVQLDVDTLDPHNSTLTVGIRLQPLMFETLITKDLDQNIHPALATEWNWESDTELVFKIREGVKFHDGTELKASDVKFSIDRSAATPRHSARYLDLESIEVIDDYTVKFITKQKSAKLMDMLSEILFGGAILSQAHVEKVGDNISTEAVGTGPYKLNKWAPGETLVVDLFEDYWGEPSVTKQITFRVITEDTARIIALETGEIDIAETVPATDLTRVKDNTELDLLTIPGMVLTYWAFNTQAEPFTNLKVRQAMNFAVDREAVTIAATNNNGFSGKTVLGVGMEGYYDGMEGYSYDPEKAKELLAEAGYPNGFSADLYVKSTDSNTMLASQVIQANLAEIGVQLDIVTLESTALMASINEGKHKTYILTASNPDVYNGLIFFYSQTPPKTGNRMLYNNPEFDALYEDLLTELDASKRGEILKAIQELLVEDAPWCPLYGQNFNVGIRSNVGGVVLDPLGFHDYSHAFATK